MGTVLVLSLVLGVLLLPATALGGPPPEGAFLVQVLDDGVWTTVGAPDFGLGYTSRTIDLGADVVQVRLVQIGGTAAQLDGVLLDGAAPAAVGGSADPLALVKLAADDDDVTDAHGASLVLTFPAGGSVLEMDARIQGDISWAYPVEYPAANVYAPVTEASAFYAVAPGDLPTTLDTDAEPFLRELVKPGSGHPDGYTHVWLADGGDALLAKIDFTSDNTMDDGEDYATVHVNTGSGLKSFKLSVPDTTWGSVDFAYTDKVAYQHKVYEFRIPWTEIGGRPESLEVAFTTYGTVSVSRPVYRFYNKGTGTHFYTISHEEFVDVVTNLGYLFEYNGIAYAVDVFHPNNDTPLWRFYHKLNGSHFYTMDLAERDNLVNNMGAVYSLDGPAYEVSRVFGPVAVRVWRFYNKVNGAHFYTADPAERDHLLTDLSATYQFEGEAFYVF